MVMRTRPNYVRIIHVGDLDDNQVYFVKRCEQTVGDADRLAAEQAFDTGMTVCMGWTIAYPIWVGIAKNVNETCRVCQGTGANPLSDNMNFLPCAECRGTGTTPVRINGL